MTQFQASFPLESPLVARYGEFNYRILLPHERPLLQRIHQLVAANLVDQGDVSIENALTTAADPVFDHDSNTLIVVIEHLSGRLAGTYSFTKAHNGQAPIVRHFGDAMVTCMGQRSWSNGWRFSMSPLFQGPQLRYQTLKVVWLICQRQQVDDFVLYFNERLLSYYRRLLIGEEIARTVISFDGSSALPVIAMRCPVDANLVKNNLIATGETHELSMVC